MIIISKKYDKIKKSESEHARKLKKLLKEKYKVILENDVRKPVRLPKIRGKSSE